jgi:hypothetical protein
MTVEEFHQSLNSEHPPEGLPPSLAALWWDAKGDWTKAHESAQQDEDRQVRGSTPTFIVRKGICQMPGTGMAGRKTSIPHSSRGGVGRDRPRLSE